MQKKCTNNDMLLFTGGPILTMTEEANAEAMAVENGVIRCIGSVEKCRNFSTAVAGSNYKEIDLKDQCLMPGFVDVHAHMMMLGMGYMWVDISYPKVKNMDELVETLKEHADDLPPGATIRGFGHNHRLLEEKRHPMASDLDRVATDRKVQIMHHSGHNNVVNTYFLNEAGITKDTPDPLGGSIGRLEDGTPNGVLFDSAADYLTGEDGVKVFNHGPNIHMPDDMETLQKIIEIGQDTFISNGVTTFNDIQVTKQEMESYLVARDSGLLKIRVGLSFLSNYLDDIIEMGFNSSSFGEGQLFFGPLKLYSDGALNAGTAYMSTKYADGVGSQGYVYHEREEMIDIIVKAHKYGLQCACHGQGDAAIENIILAYEKAQNECPREDVRHRIEHNGMPKEDQMRRMGEIGVYGIPQPHWLFEKGETYVKTYGEERAKNFCPYAWYKKYNVPLIISSDAPVAVPDPFNGIYAAVTRKTVNGVDIGGSEHKITVKEALSAYTINAAKAIHMEDKIGSLEVGKYADFVVIDKNPLEVDENEIVNIEVVETWINGEKVYTK